MTRTSAAERTLDVSLATAGLLAFAPTFPVIAGLIALDDGGPVLFWQRRLGRDREPFVIPKFRTMRGGRITRVGRWLRASGLDEVPQFFSVLAGKMRVVGPRPLTETDVARLGWQTQEHDWRWNVAPGLTGVSQIFGGRSARHSLALDRVNVRNRNLLTELGLVAISTAMTAAGKRRTRRTVQRVRAWVRRWRAAPPWRQAAAPRVVPRAFREPPALPHGAPAAPVRKRAALLINPFYPKDPHASFGKHVLTPTLALTSVAGATPPHWHVEYFDENLLGGPPPSDPVPEVVGITVHLTFAKRAYELARFYRERGAVVVLGGLHVLSCPDEVRPHADAVAVGDGVPLWPKILADVETGDLQPEYRATFNSDYRDDPAPRRRILPQKSFLTTSSLIATRGCHNRCGFCYLSTRGLKMPYRMRDPEQIAEEFRATGEPYAVFTDNNLGSDREYLRKLCAELAKLDKIWSAAVTIDVTDDPDLVRDMARAGCTGVFVGLESLTTSNLAAANKKTPPAEDYARRVRMLHEVGIQVNASFVLGFDHDDKSVFARTAEWVEKNRLECATFHILTPYPSTPLFRQMEADDRILTRDWSRYDTAHAVFRPAKMTPAELEAGYAWMYRRLFSARSIWRRRPRDARAVPAYLAMSVLYKRSNWLWHQLIKRDLVHAVWSPLVDITRRRHVKFRQGLPSGSSGSLVSAGV